MIDFLMPYIHRLIDQPPLNHNRQTLISCHCTSGSFREKKSGPFLVWYFIPGPISCPGTLTHRLLDFWKIVFFKKRTEPPGKKKGSTVEDTKVSRVHMICVKCKCKTWSAGLKSAVWSVKKVFAWRCIATWWLTGHAIGQSWRNTFTQSTGAQAWLAHGALKFYRWARFAFSYVWGNFSPASCGYSWYVWML